MNLYLKTFLNVNEYICFDGLLKTLDKILYLLWQVHGMCHGVHIRRSGNGDPQALRTKRPSIPRGSDSLQVYIKRREGECIYMVYNDAYAAQKNVLFSEN